MSEPLVSVIIPTVHNDIHIEENKSYIEKSTYKNVEIIVVDEGKERSEQRNIGIERAKGEYLLILDSDQIVSDNLISECVDKIKTCVGLYIPEIIVTEGFFGKLRNWERWFYTGTPVDCVRFVKSEGCPKFDTSMSGPEDADWDRRIKGTKKITDSCLFHLDKIGFVDYLKKKMYYTKSMRRYIEKHPYDKVLDWKWRCFGVFFENGKWRRCLEKPHYFICLMGLIFIRGVIYLCIRD